MTHSCLVHHGDLRRWHGSIGGTNDVQRDKSDLIMDIELVLMIAVEKHLEQGQLRVDRHGFKLTGLESRSLV